MDRQFSAETLGELLRALRARAEEHPDSPGLLASWPGVPAASMPAAVAALRGEGHPVYEVEVVNARDRKVRRGWAVEHEGPPALLADELTVLVRALAEPEAVPLTRALLTELAEREGVTETVRTALALAVTEACANVVRHAYAEAEALGDLEVRAARVDGHLVVEVADHGRGLAARSDGSGLGMGLSLISQLADAVEIRTERKRPGLVVRMQFDLNGSA